MISYNYHFASLSFLVGLGAGFRDMYDVFQRAAFSGAGTRWGLIYLVSRGVVPATAFTILLATGLVQSWLFATAIGCGLSLEALLRAKIYLKREQDANGNFQESYLDLFKLLRWYQDLMLVQAAELLSVQTQERVGPYIDREPTFGAMLSLFQFNKGAWKKQDEITPLELEISKLSEEHDVKSKQSGWTQIDDRILRSKFCYLIFNKLGKRGLQVLLKKTT